MLRFLRRSVSSKRGSEPRDRTRVRPAKNEPVGVHIVGRTSLDILRARDVSETGLGIYVPHRFEGCDIESEVQLVVTLPGERTFLARGIVKHRTLEEGTSPFFGVVFTEIAARHRDRIRAYVRRRLLAGSV